MTRTRSILATRNLGTLRRHAATSCLLVFDYDGTLSPIARRPERARMRARTCRLLATAARLYPCTVISGRALADISSRVSGAGVTQVFGNHGLEQPGVDNRPPPQVRRWVATLQRQLGHHRGIFVEDKRHSISVHYRATPDWDDALKTIDPLVAALPEVRVIHGAAAVNLLPRGGANKGEALKRALEISGCEKAIYMGDDATDEDAFAAVGQERLLAIRVGQSSASHARYHLDSQASIDRLLVELIQLRS